MTLVLSTLALALLPLSNSSISPAPELWVDASNTTMITIQGRTDPDKELASTCVGIQICVTIDWCTDALFCTTCTKCVTVEQGDTRMSITNRLFTEIRECLPTAKMSKGDVTINIGGTPVNASNNSGTPDAPIKSPADGTDNRVYSSTYTE